MAVYARLLAQPSLFDEVDTQLQRLQGEHDARFRVAEAAFKAALSPAPANRPPVASGTPFGRFVAETWPDVDDPDGLGRRLEKVYPCLDLLEEAKRAHLWESAEPQRKKKRHARFLTNWMSHARPAPRVAARREVTGFDPEGRPIYG
jgi:hypothetical protein